MNKKHFVIGFDSKLSKEDILLMEEEKKELHSKLMLSKEGKTKKKLQASESLIHVPGRVVVKIDVEGKNWHTFSNGQRIRRERQFNELDRRITEPVNAIVISGEDIPAGVEILVHQNAATESHRIYNYTQTSGKENDTDVRYYSIPEEQCFFWKDENNKWNPISPYATALKVYKPYSGILTGIEPQPIKDTLYVTSGDLKGQVVSTVQASDFIIVFQDTNGQEGQLLRFRPHGDEKTNREPEAVAILHEHTEKVKNGSLLVGLSPSKAKTIHELIHDN